MNLELLSGKVKLYSYFPLRYSDKHKTLIILDSHANGDVFERFFLLQMKELRQMS